MNLLKKKTRKIRDFVSYDIWTLDLEELSKAKARFIKYIKVLFITIRTFSNEKIGFQAVALSFFSTMSVVPFIAVAFTVSGGLGLADRLKQLLYQYFENSQQTIDTILGFADNIIQTSQNGPVGLVSGIVFLSVIIWMMMSVERVFNNVWKVQKSRNIFKRLSFYLAILILAPFVVMTFFSGSLIYSRLLSFIGFDFVGFSTIKTILSWLLFTVLASLTFSAMYKFIPNAEVRYKNALLASFFSGTAFTVMQYLYLETQLFVTRLNAIYGAFAAIPLFMVWINIGWFIILIGAQLSYAFQHVDNYNIE